MRESQLRGESIYNTSLWLDWKNTLNFEVIGLNFQHCQPIVYFMI